MVKPVEPVQGMLDFGENPEKPQRGKAGPSKFDEVLEKEKAERARAEASKMAEEHRAKVEAERPRTYTERLQDMGRLPKGGGGTGGGTGGAGEIKALTNPRAMKKGGKVKKPFCQKG